MGLLIEEGSRCRCGHGLLVHSTLAHGTDCVKSVVEWKGGMRSYVPNFSRSDLRNEKGRISYCYACRKVGKHCNVRGTKGW